jgi:Lrp/AsnC family transcriptional regulator for asnA, asnC and gidA
MDELDHKIIALLQLDGRASNAKIAREVGLTEATVRRRLGRLINEDYIEIRAVPNLSKLGYTTTALIGLKTMPAKQEAVADAAAGLEEVHYVAITTGSYDVFLGVATESAEQLGQFLRLKLGPIEGIRHSETFINLFIKKLTTG